MILWRPIGANWRPPSHSRPLPKSTCRSRWTLPATGGWIGSLVEWVYGTQVPRYHFEYQLQPADGGKVKLHVTITQSEVDEHFAMLVPVFADFGKGMVRIGQVGIAGNATRSGDLILPSQPKKVSLNAYKDVLER